MAGDRGRRAARHFGGVGEQRATTRPSHTRRRRPRRGVGRSSVARAAGIAGQVRRRLRALRHPRARGAAARRRGDVDAAVHAVARRRRRNRALDGRSGPRLSGFAVVPRRRQRRAGVRAVQARSRGRVRAVVDHRARPRRPRDSRERTTSSTSIPASSPASASPRTSTEARVGVADISHARGRFEGGREPTELQERFQLRDHTVQRHLEAGPGGPQPQARNHVDGRDVDRAGLYQGPAGPFSVGRGEGDEGHRSQPLHGGTTGRPEQIHRQGRR